MTSAETFVSELESKSRNSLDRLAAAYAETCRSEHLPVVELLKLETRINLEATEAAALWLTDTNDLDYKMALAEACGSGARRHELIIGRLAALGVDKSVFDPLALGFSKLFAFLRALQTTEERACAGALTIGRLALLRYQFVGATAAAAGDHETASMFEELLPMEENRQVEAGRRALMISASTEESQARARRASFRAIELLGDIQDTMLIKKFLARSTKKPPASALL